MVSYYNKECWSFYNGPMGYWDLMDGTDASPCKRPCLSTKVWKSKTKNLSIPKRRSFTRLRLKDLFCWHTVCTLDFWFPLYLKTYWRKSELYWLVIWSKCGHNWIILSKLFTLGISYNDGGSPRSLAWYGSFTSSSCSGFMLENCIYGKKKGFSKSDNHTST